MSLIDTVSPPFHVMTKPVGPLCNLSCEYCYYLEKKHLFPKNDKFRMRDDVLDSYIRQYIECQPGPELQFAWQGGEPTLMGLDFFRKVVRLQKKYAAGRKVLNVLQTNGTRLNDHWCRFLAAEGFLVGLSLDGPESIHDRYRRDRSGEGSFREVMRGMDCLRKHGVEFNTLTCVSRQSPDEATEIYTFLKREGVMFMQFIPVVERVGTGSVGFADPSAGSCADPVTYWSVTAEGFGRFLCRIYDMWIRQDVGKVFVNLFDMALSVWCGMEPTICSYAKQCGSAVAMEHDGSVYSCDHYVYPAYRLGNIMDQPLTDLFLSEAQRSFGADKETTLSDYCRSCDYLFACNGDCPKHRFSTTPNGDPGLSYLCGGYRMFFSHIAPTMHRMAELVKQGRPAAEIMNEQQIS